MESEKFLDYLRNYYVLKSDSVALNWLVKVSLNKLQHDAFKLFYSFLAETLPWQVFKPITWPVVACLIQLHVHYNSHANPAVGTRLQTAPRVTRTVGGVSGHTVVSRIQFLQYRLSIWSRGFIVCASKDKPVRRLRVDSVECIDDKFEKNPNFLTTLESALRTL
jgi:hypothetical protein